MPDPGGGGASDPNLLIAGQLVELTAGDLSIDQFSTIVANWGHALGDVLELHKPMTLSVMPDPGKTEFGERRVCEDCSDNRPYEAWPCDTVRAITAALLGQSPTALQLQRRRADAESHTERGGEPR
jgi:hypothetical protein